MLEATKVNENSISKDSFVNSLKVSAPKHRNPDIEVSAYIGNGLGIQLKISF